MAASTCAHTHRVDNGMSVIITFAAVLNVYAAHVLRSMCHVQPGWELE